MILSWICGCYIEVCTENIINVEAWFLRLLSLSVFKFVYFGWQMSSRPLGSLSVDEVFSFLHT